MSDIEVSGPHRVGRAAVGAVEVEVVDRLDLATVPKVGALLDAALERRPRQIVVDVARCRYADAAGIALLLDLHRRSWRVGCRLVLRAPSPRLLRLLEIARVDHVLHIEPRPPEPGIRPPAPTGSSALREG